MLLIRFDAGDLRYQFPTVEIALHKFGERVCGIVVTLGDRNANFISN